MSTSTPSSPLEPKAASTGAGAAESTRAIIKSVDMSEAMQQRAVETALVALEKYEYEKDMAMHIKKEFDRLYNTTWHCVVGKRFGSFVTHETKNFIYFYLGTTAILLWKTS